MNVILIGLAGAIGSMSRYGIGTLANRLLGSRTLLPVGTITVNLLGSFVMGVLVAAFANRGDMDARLRLALTVGFLGGFTTYSSFAVETVGFLQARNTPTAALYVCVTLLGAGVSCYFGLLIGKRLWL